MLIYYRFILLVIYSVWQNSRIKINKVIISNLFPNVSSFEIHQWNYKYVRTEFVYATGIIGIIFKGVSIDEQQ